MEYVAGEQHYYNKSHQVCDKSAAVFDSSTKSMSITRLQNPNTTGYICDGTQCHLVSNCNDSAFVDGGEDVMLNCKSIDRREAIMLNCLLIYS